MSSTLEIGSSCRDCGGTLAAGVCPACALGGLLQGNGAFPSEAAEPGEAEEISMSQRMAEGDIAFGRYLLKRRVASGGMGVVYEAADQKLKRTVALKMIRGSTFADEAEIARFTIEAEAAAALDHPNIVPIYEIGRMEGQPFFTMKLIEGQSLAERMKGKKRLAAREAASLLAKISHAVHHAHRRGVLHRDLKPGNILLDGSGEPWLTDFGLAKFANAEAGLTLTTDRLGTPHYMAPEIASSTAKAASIASDVWALGVLLWEVLCGVQPFRGSGPVEIMRHIVEKEPVLPPSVRLEPDLLTIARRCLEKNPAKRPGSAEEVAEELERWLRGEPIRTRRISPHERMLKWVRRKPAVAALYGVMTAAGVTAFLLWQRAEQAVVSLTNAKDHLESALRISKATKLAGDARFQVDEDPARALLLAVESVEMTENSAEGVLPEAASALTTVLQRVGGADVSVFGPKPRKTTAYVGVDWKPGLTTHISPDSRWLVSISFANYEKSGAYAALFDLTSPTQTGPLQRWKLLEKSPDVIPPKLAWMPDSRHFFCVSETGEARLWALVDDRSTACAPSAMSLGSLNVAGGSIIERFIGEPNPDGSLNVFVAWTPPADPEAPGYLQQTTCSQSGIQWKQPLRLPDIPSPASWRLATSGKRVLYYIEDRMSLNLVDFSGSEPKLSTLPMSSKIVEFDFVAAESRIAVRTSGGKFLVWPLADHGRSLPDESAIPLEAAGKLVSFREFSPDGNWLVYAVSAGYAAYHPDVNLVSLRDGAAVVQSLPQNACYAVAFSPDGRWVAAGGDRGGVSLWRTEEFARGGKSIDFGGLPSEVYHIKFSPDGKHLVATGPTELVRHWQLEGLNPGAMPVEHPFEKGIVMDLAVSPDDKLIAAACRTEDKAEANDDGVVVLTNLERRTCKVLTSHRRSASGCAFSPDGKWFASAGSDGLTKVWITEALASFAAADGRSAPPPRFEFTMEETRLHYARRLAFHPNNVLYCSTGDGVVFAWDLTLPDPGSHPHKFEVHTIHYLLPAIAVSPNGKWLAIGRHGWDRKTPDSRQFGNQILLYDCTSPIDPKSVTELPGVFIEYGNLAFSPDSRWLAAGGAAHPSAIWDLQSSDIAASARHAPVASQLMAGVSFSQDGRWLALCGNDGLFHLWDWQKSGQIRTFHSGDRLNCIRFLSDDRLAIGGAASSISLFDTRIDRLKSLALRVAGRSLTEDERLSFRLPSGK